MTTPSIRLAFALLFLSAIPAGAAAQDRLPPIPPDQMTDAQRLAADEFAANRGTEVFGPFVPLLRSPEVMLRMMAMGDYLRFRSTLPRKLNEFVVLITARAWTQEYEWYVHHPAALSAGLSPQVAQAIADGRRPEGMSEDEEIVYDFCTELHGRGRVSDRTYGRAVARFGEQATIDMISSAGYYTFLSMVMNAARTSLPPDAAPVLAPFPR
jgi:4-carboxymuconolactone decarboxylase